VLWAAGDAGGSGALERRPLELRVALALTERLGGATLS
jgi:hypothetical protein